MGYKSLPIYLVCCLFTCSIPAFVSQIENLVKTVSVSGFLKEKQTVINLHRKLFPRAFEILFFNISRRTLIMARKRKKKNKIDISK